MQNWKIAQLFIFLHLTLVFVFSISELNDPVNSNLREPSSMKLAQNEHGKEKRKGKAGKYQPDEIRE